MKFFATVIVFACWFIAFATAVISQERTPDRRLHIIATGLGRGANLIADSIERDAPTLKWTPSVIHLKGDVEIRRSIALALPKSEEQSQRDMYLIVRADEADYHEDTGEIVPRGNVHVAFQPMKK